MRIVIPVADRILIFLFQSAEAIYSSVILLSHSMKNFYCYKNCQSYIIHHSNHHALIWSCQKFHFYCRFIALQWSVFISALTLLRCQSAPAHRGKGSLCQEIIPQKTYRLTKTFVTLMSS